MSALYPVPTEIANVAHIDAAHGDGDRASAAGVKCGGHDAPILVLAGAYEEPGRELYAADA